MSEEKFIPKSKFGQWLDSRLPLLTLSHHIRDYPTPKNLNYWWTFGGILTFFLIVQIVTGLVLAMHYVAHADLAFESVEHIMRNVNYGWLIRYVHANGSSMCFLAVYIHINDDNSVYGLCFTMGTNEFLGSYSYNKLI